MLVNTPYDDVFRTMTNDCKSLLIPMVNEAFGEHYSGKEEISFHPNEHFLNRQDGAEEERITDTCFSIKGSSIKKYHLECQSSTDSSMLVRMFEYDAQIALDDGEVKENELIVSFPNSAILYLRCSETTPDTLYVRIQTPNGELKYPVPVMKVKYYTLEELFDKKLLFLIPFYIFTHESRFAAYEKNENGLKDLVKEYEKIRARLEELSKSGEITEYLMCTILDMSKKVMEHITKNHQKVWEGVKSVMVGRVLEYEAKTILNQGISQGISLGKQQGISLGKLESYIEMIRDGFISITEAAKRLQMSEEELQEKMK